MNCLFVEEYMRRYMHKELKSLQTESKWIFRLNTVQPYGLNEDLICLVFYSFYSFSPPSSDLLIVS